jgi:hypothetical protein
MGLEHALSHVTLSQEWLSIYNHMGVWTHTINLIAWYTQWLYCCVPNKLKMPRGLHIPIDDMWETRPQGTHCKLQKSPSLILESRGKVIQLCKSVIFLHKKWAPNSLMGGYFGSLITVSLYSWSLCTRNTTKNYF